MPNPDENQTASEAAAADKPSMLELHVVAVTPEDVFKASHALFPVLYAQFRQNGHAQHLHGLICLIGSYYNFIGTVYGPDAMLTVQEQIGGFLRQGVAIHEAEQAAKAAVEAASAVKH